tara:strand:+ start:364 stop:537 length:174 start_codon:yes stop_codon:yes gene_type:complete
VRAAMFLEINNMPSIKIAQRPAKILIAATALSPSNKLPKSNLVALKITNPVAKAIKM